MSIKRITRKIVSVIMSVVITVLAIIPGISASAYDSGSDAFDIDISAIPSDSVKNTYNIKIKEPFENANILTMSWDKVDNAFFYEIGVYCPSLGKKWGESWSVSDVAESGLYFKFGNQKFTKEYDMNKIMTMETWMLTLYGTDSTSYYLISDFAKAKGTVVFWVIAFDEYGKEIGESRLAVKDIKKYLPSIEKVNSPTKFKSTSTTNKIQLSWTKVEGADAYRVYYYDTSAKKYKTFKTTKSNKITIKNLKPGKTYKFKVASLRLVNKKYVKDYEPSKVLTIKTKSK